MLMAAARNGHDECVSMLISAGANVHAVTKVIILTESRMIFYCVFIFIVFYVFQLLSG